MALRATTEKRPLALVAGCKKTYVINIDESEANDSASESPFAAAGVSSPTAKPARTSPGSTAMIPAPVSEIASIGTKPKPEKTFPAMLYKHAASTPTCFLKKDACHPMSERETFQRRHRPHNDRVCMRVAHTHVGHPYERRTIRPPWIRAALYKPLHAGVGIHKLYISGLNCGISGKGLVQEPKELCRSVGKAGPLEDEIGRIALRMRQIDWPLKAVVAKERQVLTLSLLPLRCLCGRLRRLGDDTLVVLAGLLDVESDELVRGHAADDHCR